MRIKDHDGPIKAKLGDGALNSREEVKCNSESEGLKMLGIKVKCRTGKGKCEGRKNG